MKIVESKQHLRQMFYRIQVVKLNNFLSCSLKTFFCYQFSYELWYLLKNDLERKQGEKIPHKNFCFIFSQCYTYTENLIPEMVKQAKFQLKYNHISNIHNPGVTRPFETSCKSHSFLFLNIKYLENLNKCISLKKQDDKFLSACIFEIYLKQNREKHESILNMYILVYAIRINLIEFEITKVCEVGNS